MSSNTPRTKRVPWSQHEDTALLNIVGEHGTRSWSIIASSFATRVPQTPRTTKALGSRYRELRKKEHAARGKRFTAVVGGPITRARSSQVSRQRQPQHQRQHQHQDAGASQPQHQHQHQHQDAGGAPQPQATPQTSEPTAAAGTDTQPPQHQGHGATSHVPAPFAEILAAPTIQGPLRVTTLHRGYVVRNYMPGSRTKVQAFLSNTPRTPKALMSRYREPQKKEAAATETRRAAQRGNGGQGPAQARAAEGGGTVQQREG